MTDRGTSNELRGIQGTGQRPNLANRRESGDGTARREGASAAGSSCSPPSIVRWADEPISQLALHSVELVPHSSRERPRDVKKDGNRPGYEAACQERRTRLSAQVAKIGPENTLKVVLRLELVATGAPLPNEQETAQCRTRRPGGERRSRDDRDHPRPVRLRYPFPGAGGGRSHLRPSGSDGASWEGSAVVTR